MHIRRREGPDSLSNKHRKKDYTGERGGQISRLRFDIKQGLRVQLSACQPDSTYVKVKVTVGPTASQEQRASKGRRARIKDARMQSYRSGNTGRSKGEI